MTISKRASGPCAVGREAKLDVVARRLTRLASAATKGDCFGAARTGDAIPRALAATLRVAPSYRPIPHARRGGMRFRSSPSCTFGPRRIGSRLTLPRRLRPIVAAVGRGRRGSPKPFGMGCPSPPDHDGRTVGRRRRSNGSRTVSAERRAVDVSQSPTGVRAIPSTKKSGLPAPPARNPGGQASKSPVCDTKERSRAAQAHSPHTAEDVVLMTSGRSAGWPLLRSFRRSRG